MTAIKYNCKPAQDIKFFSKAETADLRNAWIKVFAKNEQGARLNAYLWHIFSYERYPAISGVEAEALYKKPLATEYILLPNDGEEAVLVGQLPESCDLSDYLVFPKNLAWTMAFTHEDGWLGPYFAQHKNYEILAANNEKAWNQQKLKEVAIKNAKEKGWMQ